MAENTHDEDDDLDDDDATSEEADDDEVEGDGLPRITRSDIEVFGNVQRQIKSFADEIGIVSKKKADSPLNKFKINLINYSLSHANTLLGERYRPFPSFTVFDVEGDVPTASDVSVILSQYLSALDKYRTDHTNTDGYNRHWRVKSDLSPSNDYDEEEDEVEGDDDEEVGQGDE